MQVFMREYLTSANRPSAYFAGLSLAEFPYQVWKEERLIDCSFFIPSSLLLCRMYPYPP